MYVSGTMNNTVSGNRIGTDAAGTGALGNAFVGVFIGGGASQNTIGLNNIIAFNDEDGVQVEGSSTLGNTITENSIHSNGGLGIHLIDDGNVSAR